MRLFIVITIIFSFFNTPVFSQIQKWWETNGAPSSQKQVLQTMPSNLVSRIEKSNDTSRVFILNGQGNQMLNKAIIGVESNMITADGIDSSGNSILWLSYSSGLQNSCELVIDIFNVSDTVSNSVFYSTVANSFQQPLGIYSESQFVYLVLAVYQADSSSRLKWLKFDTYSGLAVDSFASTIQMNAIYNYAEIQNNRIIVNGSDLDGKKNWLFDINAKTVVDWQWNFSSSTSWNNELIRFSPNDMIFSVVHTSTDSTLKDANLILCDTSLNVQWTINYNSEYNLNDTIVDAAFYNDKIYIAGFVETDTLNKDFVIASLNIDGTLNWELKYDGPGVQAIDLGVSLSVDEVGDIYFTGQSIEGNQSNLFSIQLDEFGSVLWESDLAEAAQKRAVEIVTRDGNVYLSGQNLSTSINNFLILYKDSLKIESIQKLHIEMLASGLSLIQDDFQLKRLVWDKFSRQFSFRRTVSLSSMHKYLRSKGYDIFRLMNAKINRDYKLDRNSKTVELILANLEGQKEIPFIHMPFFKDLQEIEFVEGRSTIFAYSRDWPPTIDDALPCFECDGPVTVVPCFDCPLIPDMLVVNLEANVSPFLQAEDRVLYSCLFEKTADCVFCSDVREPVPDIPTPGSTMHYEFGLKLPHPQSINNLINPCSDRIDSEEENNFFEQLIPDNLLGENITYNGYVTGQLFDVPAVTLRSFGNSKYFMRDISTGKHRSVRYSLYKSNYYCNDHELCSEYGNILTFCRPWTTFRTLGLNLNGIIVNSPDDYSIAEGGFYEIRSEFNDYPSLFFYNPIGIGMFYSQGPDLGIVYNPVIESFNCHGEGQHAITENNSVDVNELYVTGHTVFNTGLSEFSSSMVNYNPDNVINQWGQNNLIIGLSRGSSIILNENLLNANEIVSECPSEGFEIQTVICTLSCSYDGWFEFLKNDINSDIQIPVNTPIKIRILAHFENGEIIDKCITHTFISGSLENFPLDRITVSPSGRISEYLPNSENYKIIFGL